MIYGRVLRKVGSALLRSIYSYTHSNTISHASRASTLCEVAQRLCFCSYLHSSYGYLKLLYTAHLFNALCDSTKTPPQTQCKDRTLFASQSACHCQHHKHAERTERHSQAIPTTRVLFNVAPSWYISASRSTASIFASSFNFLLRRDCTHARRCLARSGAQVCRVFSINGAVAHAKGEPDARAVVQDACPRDKRSRCVLSL